MVDRSKVVNSKADLMVLQFIYVICKSIYLV